MLKKPQSKSDLLPPFDEIGEEGWDEKLRQILVDYEVPLPLPCSKAELADCETRLGFALPRSFKMFIEILGPVDFNGLRILGLDEIKTAEDFWFVEYFEESDRRQLPTMLQVAEAVADNVHVIDLESGKCGLCSHDPAGLFEWLPSFDTLVKIAIIDLSWGYYGWPDDEIAEMAHHLRMELFPYL